MPRWKVHKVCLICLKSFRNKEGKGGHGSEGHHRVLELSSSAVGAGALKVTDGTGVEESGTGAQDDEAARLRESDLYSRFLHLSSRYLQLRTFTEPLLEGLKESKIRAPEGGVELEAFCDTCGDLVRSISNLHVELQRVKLNLFWKLSELGGKLKNSKKVQSMKKQQGKGLLRTVAEQLNVKVIKQLVTFRKTLELKCTRKILESSPKPVIPRGLFPEEWKHTFSDTRTSLMRLLIVFLLAAPKRNEEAVKDPVPEKGFTLRRHRKNVRIPNNLSDVEIKEENPDPHPQDESNYDEPCGDDDYDNDTIMSVDGAVSPACSTGPDADFVPGSEEEEEVPKMQMRLRRKRRAEIQCSSENDSSDKQDDKQEYRGPGRGTRTKRILGLKRHMYQKHHSKISSTHTCRQCDEKFTTQRNLLEHRKNVHLKGARVQKICTICKKKFRLVKDLLKHLESTHEAATAEEKLHQCWFCPKKFSSFQMLRFHRKGPHSKSMFRCSHCNMMFHSVDKHNRHLVEHMETSSVRRDLEKQPIDGERTGDIKTDSSPNLPNKESLHFQGHPSANKTTPENESTSQNLNTSETNSIKEQVPVPQSGLPNPNGLESPPRGLPHCPKCGWAFIDPDLMELHKLVHSETVSPPLPCPKCVMIFKCTTTLHKHYYQDHTLHRPFECPQCGKKLTSESSLRKHTSQVHRHVDMTGTPLSCSHCEYQTWDPNFLKIHTKRMHDPNSILNCTMEGCGEKFITRRWLERHLKRVHNVGEKLWCTICNVEYADLTDLVRHNRIVHTNQTFVCELCGAKFKKRHTLKDHMKNIHGPTPRPSFVCSDCGRTFKTVYGLKYHVASMHTPNSELRHGCPHCPKRYHRIHLMKLHIKSCEKRCATSIDTSMTMMEKPAGGQSTSNSPINTAPSQNYATDEPHWSGRPKKKAVEEEEITDKSILFDTAGAETVEPMEEKIPNTPLHNIAMDTPFSATSGSSMFGAGGPYGDHAE